MRDILSLDSKSAALSEGDREYIEVLIKYEGYLLRQQLQIDRFLRVGERRLPEDFDYMALNTLRIEARQKLAKARPSTLNQAARIPGVTPGDIQALMIYLKREG